MPDVIRDHTSTGGRSCLPGPSQPECV
jgi:hypothetical protein